MTSPSEDNYTRWIGTSDSELTVEGVEQILSAIPDDLWVAAACLDRLADDVAVAQSLLNLGVERTAKALQRYQDATNKYSSQDIPEIRFTSSDGDSPEPQQQDTLVTHFHTFPIDAQLCHIRSMLLARLDRLNTFVEVCRADSESSEEDVEAEIEDWEDDPWDNPVGSSTSPGLQTTSTKRPIPLPDFLTDDLLHIACSLALQQKLACLHVLLERHGPNLWPYRFIILDSIPGHTHPSKYSIILPSVSSLTNSEEIWTPKTWRPDVDFSDTSQVKAAIEKSGTLPHIYAIAESSLDGLKAHPEPLTANELSSWYKSHAESIISLTGMVDIALGLVQHGAAHGASGLDEFGEELSLFARLVYDAGRADAIQDQDWSLSLWLSMGPPDIIRAYLAHSSPESLANDISRLVMPYLFVLEFRAERAGAPDPSIPTRLLYDYILTSPLAHVAAIFEASKPTLSVSKRLIKNDEDMARLALACLYGSESKDEWSTMSSIFECLPAWDPKQDDGDDVEDAFETTIASLGAFVTPSTSGTHSTPSDLLIFFKPLPLSSLSRALDVLDVHLESGEILSRWGVAAPLRWFLQSSGNAAEQRAWANRMTRRAGGTDDQLNTVEDWEWLLEDMLKLSGTGDSGLRGAFGLLAQDDVMQIFLAGVLSTGKFDIAKTLIQSSRKLNFTAATIEDLCLSCSREFYDNANSGNYKFGDMKLAYDCLSVPRPSDRIEKEKEFIEATSRLCSFNVMSRPGVPIAPIEIRLTKDRLSLVSRVLSSNNDAYKHTEVILDLVYKLGFRGDVVAEVKTLAMLADTALQNEDFQRAYDCSDRMVDTVLNMRASFPLGVDDPKLLDASEVCWVACFQLGRQPEFDDVHKKLSLLGRALELCPAEKLHDVLAAWRRLEKEDIELREEKLAQDHTNPTNSGPQKRSNVAASTIAASASLRARLQDFHMPSPPLLSTPDAAALASRTFRTVAANFPFSVGSRGRSHASQQGEENDRSPSRTRPGGQDVQAQATRVFSRGIGWLIGAEDDA